MFALYTLFSFTFLVRILIMFILGSLNFKFFLTNSFNLNSEPMKSNDCYSYSFCFTNKEAKKKNNNKTLVQDYIDRVGNHMLAAVCSFADYTMVSLLKKC